MHVCLQICKKHFRQLLFVSFIISISASCESSKRFQSRRYTAGNYLSYKHKAAKVKVNEPAKCDPVYASSQKEPFKELIQEIKPDLKAPGFSQPDIKEKGNTPLPKKVSAFLFKNIKTKTPVFQKNYLSKIHSIRKKKYGIESESPFDPKALLSTILGVLGIALEIFGYILVVAIAFEYTFLFMLVLGYILGIIALILSIKSGVRNRRKENPSGINFTFSFLGTIFGVIAMCLVIFLLIVLLVGF